MDAGKDRLEKEMWSGKVRFVSCLQNEKGGGDEWLRIKKGPA